MLRIGELSERSGVSPELLRAWERRYGLLRPTRTAGGYRLYSADDERRLVDMRAHLDSGASAAEAARLVLADQTAPTAAPELARGAGELRDALDGFGESAAQAALDRLLAAFSLETVLREVVLPYLHELGERWTRGEASVAQEHFASQVLRGRLLGLARGWDRGGGPRAVLACMPGEQHDLGLIVFGLGLRDRGWRITFLGPDTPLDTLTDAAEALRPDAVVLLSRARIGFDGADGALGRLADIAPVWVAGPGASTEPGVRVLAGDPLTAAEHVAGHVPARAQPNPAQRRSMTTSRRP